MCFKKTIILFTGLFIAASTLAVENLSSSSKVYPSGVLEFGGLKFFALHFNSYWNSAKQNAATIKPNTGFPIHKKNEFYLKGNFSRGFKIEEKIKALTPESISYHCSMNSSSAIPSNELALCVKLPVAYFAGKTIWFNDKKIILPEKYDETISNRLYEGAKISKVVLPVSKGDLVIKGDLNLLLQDNRKYNYDNFSLRIKFKGAEQPGAIQKATLQLQMAMKRYPSFPLNISGQCNMESQNDSAVANKVERADQKSGKCMHIPPAGNYNFCGLTFNIPDSVSSYIALQGRDRPNLPKTSTIPGDGANSEFLYLLHAVDGTQVGNKEKIGNIIVTYDDSTKTVLPVQNGIDVGNWKDPRSVANGFVAWSKEKQAFNTGLYLSKFKIDNKPIKIITLESNNKSVWLITALTLSPKNIILPKNTLKPLVIKQNKEWQPFVYDRDIVSGSIMDFSSLLDAPAGKYGPITIKDGKFVFANAPEKRAKFYGVNLCFSAQFQSKELCDKLAGNLARMGYNSVRFHHFDGMLTKPNGKNGVDFIPQRLDQLDYLFSCLKKRGIYITIDLYTFRTLPRGTIKEFPNIAMRQQEIKGLAFVCESVMKNWEDFSKKLLTHVNPYTGLSWKDDPALISMSLINENTIFSVTSKSPVVVKTYEKLFKKWLDKHQLKPENEAAKKVLKNQFLVEVYNRGYQRMKQFIRSLGVKQPLSDQNFWENVNLSLMRQHYDYVDIHGYWDHPSFPENRWTFPIGIRNQSDISSYADIPLGLSCSRIFGKPFMCTEFSFVCPNKYRAEGGLMMGAYSALQDWDGIYRFAYSHGETSKEGPAHLFDVFNEPSSAVSEKMGLLCFLRGDVKPSEICIPTLVTENYMKSKNQLSRYPKSFCRLGLIGKTGTIVVPNSNANLSLPAGTVALDGIETALAGKKWSKPYFDASSGMNIFDAMNQAGIFKSDHVDLKKKMFRSSTDQLCLNQAEKTLHVKTERSEGGVLPASKVYKGQVLEIKNNTAYAAFFAAAMDDKELSKSKRILILHLTDIQNSGATFSDSTMMLWTKKGSLPHLLRRGSAEISLKGDFSKYKLFAVNLAGKRLKEITIDKTADGITFNANTHMLKNGVVAYELILNL